MTIADLIGGRLSAIRGGRVAAAEEDVLVSASVLGAHDDVYDGIDAGRQVYENVAGNVETPPVDDVLEDFRYRYRQVADEERREYNEYHLQQLLVLRGHLAGLECPISDAAEARLAPEDVRPLDRGAPTFRHRVRPRARVLVRYSVVVPGRLRAQQILGIVLEVAKKLLRQPKTVLADLEALRVEYLLTLGVLEAVGEMAVHPRRGHATADFFGAMREPLRYLKTTIVTIVGVFLCGSPIVVGLVAR